MKPKLIFPILMLILAMLACDFGGLFGAASPTETPEIPPGTDVPPIIPTATPIATPIPGARIEGADHALLNGDWDRAIAEYTLAFDDTADPEIRAAALLGLGRTSIRSGDLTKAFEYLNTLIAYYPDSSHKPAAFFALGQAYEAQGSTIEAANAYLEYLNTRPGLIDFYVSERIGDLLYAAGEYSSAIQHYQNALGAGYFGDPLYINVKIGESYTKLGDHATAIVIYEDVFNRSGNDYTKALMKRYIGDAYIALGQPELAYPAYLFAVENYPLSYDSYLALVELVNAGVPVNELDRGIIDYYAGEYGYAIDAFTRYLDANPTEHEETAHYYMGLCLRAIGDNAGAIAAWRVQIEEHIYDQYWADAFEKIADTYAWYLSDYENAIAVYLEFLDRAPDHPSAPEFLYYAAMISERIGDLNQAATHWENIGIQYSTSGWAYDGLFQAGIARYRLADYTNAIRLFQSALGVAGTTGEEAAAFFWTGKSYQQMGDITAANSSWLQASTTDPTGYYSERANDLILDRAPFTPPDSYSFEFDKAAEQAEAEAWMRVTFGIPDTENLQDITPLLSDPRLIRGTELWNLGLLEEARAELESLRISIQSDPANTYRLANYLIDMGLYRPGIFAALQVLNLAGMDDAGTFTAPVYFNRLRFGVYYSDLVLPAAEAYGFDPLFLLSVIRQESLFEGFVTSVAGARGLMQIMEVTGNDIHTWYGWPVGYTDEDLYRPLISITYGSYYLDKQRNSFAGDLYTALAAYNAGPGFAAIWEPLANGDPDLFVEVIRFEYNETRNYIRYIYEIFTIYSKLYATTP